MSVVDPTLIDKVAEFFGPADELETFAKRENRTPLDIKKYRLTDPALLELARIVRGAYTSDRALAAESSRLYAIASGCHAQSPGRFPDDHALLKAGFPIYDVLYACCQNRTSS